MPLYCYETKRGRVINLFFSMGKAPQVVADPKFGVLKRSYQAERVGVPAPKNWPMECVASGVNASQAGELRAHLANAGVPTEVTSDGNPVYRNMAHRKKALKARGLVDKKAYI
jgi:hypothetical protein